MALRASLPSLPTSWGLHRRAARRGAGAEPTTQRRHPVQGLSINFHRVCCGFRVPASGRTLGARRNATREAVATRRVDAQDDGVKALDGLSFWASGRQCFRGSDDGGAACPLGEKTEGGRMAPTPLVYFDFAID